MSTAIHRQVAEAREGRLARVVARLESGWAVLGDPQILPGYCLLLPDPVVPHLNALTGDARRQFLDGLDEAEVVVIHDEADGIAARAAAETVKKLLVGTDAE